jgi:hypothetical protein
MSRPDFARTDLRGLSHRDLQRLIENLPRPGGSYEEIAEILQQMPSTLESMLTSEYVFQLIFDRRRTLLDLSPFLLFGVLLRRSLSPPRSGLERRVINYLSNLLAVFVRTERLYRIEPYDTESYEYVLDLVAEAERADSRRQFLTYAHIGNYALFLTGLRSQWLEHRHRYHRRPVDTNYYAECGRSYFDRAARHPRARELALEDVFLRLALSFEHYRRGLQHMVRHFFPAD